MYRIFCESYNNYLNSFDEDNYRLKISEPFKLIVDNERFNSEKEQESEIYKKLCDLVYFMKKNMKRFPKFKAFLWTLEQVKLVNSFLKLAYWY